jgi:transglutaminase-like putative cysteine protease
MLLKITHETDLVYTAPINETVMELRMAPRQEQDQHRLSFKLAIGPAAPVTGYFDWLGNLVHAFTINAFHERIRILATSVVQTDRSIIDAAALPDAWPIDPGALDYDVCDYLRFGALVVDVPPLRELAASLNVRSGMPLGDVAHAILRVIADQFIYEKGVTNAASPISEILAHGRGVCQDFTHLMIGLSRALGIPARYVSGFVHPDAERYRGYTQTHAWCELFFPSAGWIGFDPTNRCMVSDNFVRIAVGRDYRDVPPNRGMFKGNGQERMEVAVHSEELGGVPSGLPAERIEALGIRTMVGNDQTPRDPNNQQVSQQQQQHRDGELNHQQQQQQQQQQ